MKSLAEMQSEDTPLVFSVVYNSLLLSSEHSFSLYLTAEACWACVAANVCWSYMSEEADSFLSVGGENTSPLIQTHPILSLSHCENAHLAYMCM